MTAKRKFELRLTRFGRPVTEAYDGPRNVGVIRDTLARLREVYDEAVLLIDGVPVDDEELQSAVYGRRSLTRAEQQDEGWTSLEVRMTRKQKRAISTAARARGVSMAKLVTDWADKLGRK